MGLVRAAARVAKGWRQDQVQAAGRRAVSALSEIVAPFAPQRLAAFRAEGHRLVLSTTTPADMIAPFAEAIRLRRPDRDRLRDQGRPLHGPPLRGLRRGGRASCSAVREWAEDNGIDLADCHACSDSIFDVPLLSSVGSPHAVNPDPSLTVVATARRWPVEHWDRPPGVPSVVGLEPYHMLRPFVRKLSFPYARFDIAGVENVPRAGPVLLGVEPPQLLRRGRAGARGARHRASGALPRQEGDLRRARGRDRSPGPSAASPSTAAADRASRCERPRPP